MYIKREEETVLREKIISDKFEFVVIYGRRRVGKTTIVKNVLKKSEWFYYLWLDVPYREQLKMIKNKISEFFQDSFLEKIEVDTYKTLFEYLVKIIGKNKKFVIAFDEFQYFFYKNPSVLSEFQYIIDEILCHTKIKLIILWSSISMIEHNILWYKSPLYWRKTAVFEIKQFNIIDFGKFFPDYNIKSLVEIYTVIGGIPYYAEFLDKNSSVIENIKNVILAKWSIFLEETINILKYEIHEFRTYFLILSYISQGVCKFSEISSKSWIEKNNLTKYLFTLEGIWVIQRQTPVLENKLKSKKWYYRIHDLFTKFWFNYIWSHKDLIDFNLQVLYKHLNNTFDYYVSQSIDDIVHQIVLKSAKIPFDIYKIWRQWDKMYEIDICGYNYERDKLLIWEIKWQNKKVDMRVLIDLKAKSKYISWFKEVYYILVSKNGFTESLKSIKDEKLILVDLSE